MNTQFDPHSDDIDINSLIDACIQGPLPSTLNNKTTIQHVLLSPDDFLVPFLEKLLSIIQNPQSSSDSKFLALQLLKEAMDTKNPDIIHEVEQRTLVPLATIATQIESNDNPEKETLKNFQRLLLECIYQWNVWFGEQDQNKELTKYRSKFLELAYEVQFPEQLLYFKEYSESEEMPSYEREFMNKEIAHDQDNGAGFTFWSGIEEVSDPQFEYKMDQMSGNPQAFSFPGSANDDEINPRIPNKQMNTIYENPFEKSEISSKNENSFEDSSNKKVASSYTEEMEKMLKLIESNHKVLPDMLIASKSSLDEFIDFTINNLQEEEKILKYFVTDLEALGIVDQEPYFKASSEFNIVKELISKCFEYKNTELTSDELIESFSEILSTRQLHRSSTPKNNIFQKPKLENSNSPSQSMPLFQKIERPPQNFNNVEDSNIPINHEIEFVEEDLDLEIPVPKRANIKFLAIYMNSAENPVGFFENSISEYDKLASLRGHIEFAYPELPSDFLFEHKDSKAIIPLQEGTIYVRDISLKIAEHDGIILTHNLINVMIKTAEEKIITEMKVNNSLYLYQLRNLLLKSLGPKFNFDCFLKIYKGKKLPYSISKETILKISDFPARMGGEYEIFIKL